MSSKEIVALEAARRLGWRLNYLYSELRVGRFPGARKENDIWLIPAAAVEVRRKARMKLRRARQHAETPVPVGA